MIELVGEGYSFRQIAQHLTAHGISVSARGLQQWHRKYVGRRRPARIEGTGPAAHPAPAIGAALPAPLASDRSMAEHLAVAENPTQPKKKHRPQAESPGLIVAALDKLTK